MQKVVVGGKTLDNIAIAMYKETKNVFREYIQNATDAIDDAVQVGVLQKDEGRIHITIDDKARRIIIMDNGIGVSALNFKSTLIDIGNSDKKLDKDRGYRGIGRFCGLGYCKTLIFTSTRKGENKLSSITFNAEKLHTMLNEDEKYTAEIILNEVVTFGEEDNFDADKHFFKVELLDVTNNDLLNVVDVRNYLSFVAPVEYSNQFTFQEQIKNYAATLDFKITEYKIYVNGEQVIKDYKDNFTTKNGADKIFNLEFRDFRDDEDKLIAWSWIGISTFEGIIQQTKTNPNQMRCIRLRVGNIQIGDENTLRDLFKEPRGITYFVGEVYAVDTNLRPNSQRDYFADNDTLKLFETKIKNYFEELYNLYRYASEVRSAFNAIKEPEIFMQKIEAHTPAYQKTHRAEHDAELDRLLEKAEKKQEFIDEERQAVKDEPETIFSQVFKHIDEKNPPCVIKFTPPPLSLTSWSEETKKLYEDIHEIILANPKLSGEKLLDKINKELAK